MTEEQNWVENSQLLLTFRELEVFENDELNK